MSNVQSVCVEADVREELQAVDFLPEPGAPKMS